MASRKSLLLRAGFTLILLAYFWRFVGPGLHAHFNPDDPMNIYYYWSRGAWQLVRNLVLFFSTYGRPMGGVYYSVLYHFFGLNPLPYHVATTALLLLNTFLTYRVTRLLTESQLTGGLAAFVAVYHAGMAHLVYLPAFVYDVLSTTFYLAALSYYLSIRTRDRSLTRTETAVFLLLSVCALDAKEMAITLPVVVFLYEAIWHRPLGWARAIPATLAGALTAVYVLGKAFGPDSLTRRVAYRPTFTWSRYWESTERFLNTIFYQPMNHNLARLAGYVVLVLLLLAAAVYLKQKALVWMGLFAWIAPLPIAFVPDRGGGCLYLALIGWAMILATVAVLVLRRFPKTVPGEIAAGVLVVAGMAAFWAKTAHEDRHVPPGVRNPGEFTWNVLQQIQALQPSVKPGSRIYVADDPFDGYDTRFLLELTYHDRSVNVWLGRKFPLPADQIARMDYCFTFEDGKLKRLPRP
jgi:hypothetical protein